MPDSQRQTPVMRRTPQGSLTSRSQSLTGQDIDNRDVQKRSAPGPRKIPGANMRCTLHERGNDEQPHAEDPRPLAIAIHCRSKQRETTKTENPGPDRHNGMMRRRKRGTLEPNTAVTTQNEHPPTHMRHRAQHEADEYKTLSRCNGDASTYTCS